jgi:DNA-3-methyladenine glycosylase
VTVGSGGGGPPPGLLFPRRLLAGDTIDAARAVLGARLVRVSERIGAPADGPAAPRRVGRIVEVEAYIGEEDRASHARMGRTARNAVMFGDPGIAYVYLIYGIHHCLNVVTEPDGHPAAVLIRAVEPIAGIEAMRAARTADAARRGRQARHVVDHQLAAGPGLVCLAFGINRTMTGLDLCDPASPLRLEARPAGEPGPLVEATPRVGVAYAGEPWTSVPWRFVVPDSPSLSIVRSVPVS